MRKNRREGGRIEPLANHNYLKKVYESNRPHFSPSGSGTKAKNQSPEQTRQEEKRHDAIMYIERMRQFGKLDEVKHTESYQIWLKWQQETGERQCNPKQEPNSSKKSTLAKMS